MRPLILFLACLALFAPGAAAQPERWEGRRIATIQFIPPEQPLDPQEIKEILPLKIGTPLRMADVRAAIERLYATGRYEDMQVDAADHNGDVIIRFITRDSHFIGHVSVTGGISVPPNAGQLVNATRLELGQPFSEDKIATARDGVKRLLELNGLYRSNIRPEFDYDPVAQQVHIRFVVDQGPRARFTGPALQGNLKAEPARLVDWTGWRRFLIGGWKPVTQDRVLRGLDSIRRKYEKQGRLQAKVSLQSLDYDEDTNRVRPAIEVDAGPRIQVNTVGAGVSKGRLRQLVPIYEEHTVDHDLLVEGSRNLRDWFQSRGYFDAEVEPKQQRVINDKAEIDFLINTGRRHKLEHLEIKGNKYFTTDAIRERMFLQPASLLQFRHGRYSEALLQRDQDSIANLYKSNGFRDVSVNARVVDNYRGKSGGIAVFMIIEEGPQWYVNDLTIKGIQSLNEEEIRGMVSSAPGQPYSEYNVSVDRDTILAQYFTRGFPNATFEWNSQPASGKPHHMDVQYVIQEGRQQFVRQVLITGLKRTDPTMIHRNILLNPGDPLSPSRMWETQRRLYDLGVFARVNTAIQNPEGETGRKYVLYDMEEASRWSLSTGFGAEVARIGGGCRTCLDAPSGQTGFAPRVSADLTRFNMLGLGHALSFRTRVSTLERRALLNYSAPRFRNQDGLNLSFTGLYDTSLNVRTFASKRFEGSAQLSQRYSKATTLFYRYTYRRVSVDPATLKISPLLIPQLAQPVRLGMLSFNGVQDRRDDPTDPRRGIYNTLDLGLAERIFGSQRNFLRLLARNSTYHALTRKYVLARATTFGDLYAFRFRGPAIQSIPLAERFFSGGGTSHRGFGEQQAGPRDTSTGFPIGGTALFTNNTELRFPLIGENIGAVLFHDMGNVYSGVQQISFRVRQRDLEDFDYMVHAAGFGVRYRTPIGPVRLDFAYSMNPPRFFGFKGTLNDFYNAGTDPCRTQPDRCLAQSSGHFQFYFSIGQTF
ncbi:MAG: POTRA domain-containing protein [Bryobacteraceae bacterium]